MNQGKTVYLTLSLLAVLLTACDYEDLLTGHPKETPQVVISAESDLLTMINIMQPDSAEQAEVATLLGRGMDSTASRQDGFVSASIHQSLDNHYVVNYAQWRSLEDVQAVVDLVQRGEAPEMAEAFARGNPEFHPYAVTAQFFSVDRPDNEVAIDQKGNVLTAINLLVPNEGVSQSTVARLLKEAMAEEASKQPGFISATVHESLDNDYVVNYAQWKDQASLDAIVELVGNGDLPKLGQAFTLSTPDFHPYAVVSTHFEQ